MVELSLRSPQRVGKTNDQQQTPNPIRGAQGAGPVCCKCGYERDLHSPGGHSLWERKGGGVGGPVLCVREGCGEQRTGTLGGQSREGDDKVAGNQGLRRHVRQAIGRHGGLHTRRDAIGLFCKDHSGCRVEMGWGGSGR